MLQRVLDWNIKAGQTSKNQAERRERWEKDFPYRELACRIFLEEVQELLEAAAKNDTVEILDGAADVLFTLYGIVGKAGLDPYFEEVFREVCDSNDSKLTGSTVKREDGKQGKGSDYKAPNILGIIDKDLP